MCISLIISYLCGKGNTMNFKIKELCKEKGISMKELAARLGITYQSLYDSINGNPTLSRLEEIATALEVDTYDLFVNPHKTTPNSTEAVCPHCGKPIHISIGE